MYNITSVDVGIGESRQKKPVTIFRPVKVTQLTLYLNRFSSLTVSKQYLSYGCFILCFNQYKVLGKEYKFTEYKYF